MKKSVWSESVNIKEFPRLSGDIKTDVLIIGGGMAGILCAYRLKQAGVDCVLVEGNRLGSGITKNTTAKITSQHGLIYDRLIRAFGLNRAKLYLEANQNAVAAFKEICGKIPCGFEEKSAFVYSRTDRKAIEREAAAVNRLGFKAKFSQEIPLPFRVAGAVEFENQAQFNPMQFIAGISEGLNIYEHTFVKELVKNTAVTDGAGIKAKIIIAATHFPFINKHGGYFMKLYQQRSYVIALENAAYVDGMYIEETENGLSFRNYGDFLLIGGGGHRTGKSGGNWRALREFAAKRYPNAVEKYAWAAQDCMSLDGIPYIGRYAESTPNFYVASGFNKWGMTSSMVAAKILTDTVTGKPNRYAKVFSPQRSALKPQLFINGAEAVGSLFNLTAKHRCPHMGCALKWNKAEQTWDCPCHGSRFEKNGRIIDNPSTGNLNR